MDLAIIGAGAAGLMAAIFAGRHSKESAGALRVCALEGAAKLGAKILISGGGRCNVTHDVVLPEDFNGGNSRNVAKVLRSFDVPKTIQFFEEIGVELKREENGKLFPVSDRARSVLDAMLQATSDSGAEILSQHRLVGMQQEAGGFALHLKDGRELHARKVVLATGGLSIPKSGSDGAGYEFARSLGHTVTRTLPALVPLMLPKGHFLTGLSGLSIETQLTISLPSGKVIRREVGSLLFTHFGLSGPVVLDISRHLLDAPANARLTMSFINREPGELDNSFLREARINPRLSIHSLLQRYLPERMSMSVLEHVIDVEPSTMLTRLPKEKRELIIRSLTELEVPIAGDRGYDYAEVTAGGVPLDEVSVGTMESRIVKGLYLCGEILDVDGRIGGYNFQWAWASGRLAGIAAAKSCSEV